jgi:AcrR family transcriptional regulator
LWRVPKVTDAYRSAKRDEIADAALRAFRRKGFQAASMADIIAESGLSAGAIYGHYKSKADIVLEVARRVVGERVVDIQRLTESGTPFPPPAVLRLLVQAMTRELVDPTIVVQIWGEAVVDDRLRQLALEVFGRLQSVLGDYLAAWYEREHGLSPEDAAATAQELVPLYVSAVQGYLLQLAILPDFDPEGYFDMLDRRLPH